MKFEQLTITKSNNFYQKGRLSHKDMTLKFPKNVKLQIYTKHYFKAENDPYRTYSFNM